MAFKVGDLVRFKPIEEGDSYPYTTQQGTLDWLKNVGATAGVGPWRVVGRTEGDCVEDTFLRIKDPFSSSPRVFTFLESRFSLDSPQLSLF